MKISKLDHYLICFLSILFLTSVVVVSIEDDIRCLRGVKDSLKDPLSVLHSSWNFGNTTAGFLCKFVGVSCWNDQENRLIALELRSFELGGEVPASLQFCQSLQTLDLSDNALSGSIPSQLCKWLPFLVRIDLSKNQFTGSIPVELVDCKFLNSLSLGGNRLSGSIPYQLARLDRLKTLSVANNDLSGQIPSFLSNFDSAGFEGNKGLCGRPLKSKCGGGKKKNLVIFVAAGIIGAFVSLLLGFALWWWCFMRSSRRGKGKYGMGKDDDSVWVERLKPHRLVQVSLFKKPLVKIRLADLLAATNNFDPSNIIISTRTGSSYRAILRDGSALAIKRLQTCKLTEKQFRAEMISLGQLRHPNLVPLLGFCALENEKLVVYKDMPSGSLYSMLYGTARAYPAALDWTTRLKIGIGAARGLAWLHHGCQPPFMHQNISSNVILLDEDLDPRITDFGLAKLMYSSGSQGSTFNLGDFGEFGYVAPEYSSTMVASLKGDVYGFGVVLLELVTGRKPLEVSNADEEFKGNLVDWVNQLSGAGQIKDVIDKSLCGKGDDDEILQFLKVACACVISRPKERWSMYQVYHSLKTIGEERGFSEQFDEFPLIFGKQDPNHQQ
ncbi:hypothetical protein IFM89_012988 [Coptis chinensis]|uniref:Protein kinase domain-containing protein n=1 Tax=Coptis chinensis TaxID=261450 RepID=A0A835IT90_9MAGN|nr:hypothetical protein IFM89_012988 [Coptis chinensis]